METSFRGDSSALRDRVPLASRLQPDFYRNEVERIFRRAWMPVVSASDLPSIGSYVVVDLPTFKASVLLIRGKDGQIRGFHNICRHRGNKIIRSGSGCVQKLSCGFHGWLYSIDGALAGVPDESQFACLDKANTGLLPVTTQVWEDYVFLNMDKAPRESLSTWLDHMYGGYKGYFEGREKIASYRFIIDCNWNIALNSFTEGYHTLWVHKNTVPDYQGGNSNPLRHRPFLELVGRHAKYSAQRNPDRKPPPVEDFAYRHGHKLYPAFPAYEPGDPAIPPAVNPSRYEGWAYDLMELFPNFITITGKHFHTSMYFWPVDVDRTEMRVEAFAFKPRKPSERLCHAYFNARHREVLREDVNVMEALHNAMKSGAMEEIILSKQEMLLQQHYASADAMLRQT